MQITFQCKITCSVLFSVTYHRLLLFILYHVALILNSLFAIFHSISIENSITILAALMYCVKFMRLHAKSCIIYSPILHILVIGNARLR